MLESFFIFGDIPVIAEKGTYIPSLVFASYLIASFGSFAALTMASRIHNTTSIRAKQMQHWLGAIALGCGIWSMHFIGMLAYKMRMVVHYDPTLTFLSMLVAVTVAWFVLHITQPQQLSLRRIAVCAVLLGLGICAMHYTGMAAMQMDASVRYIPSIFLLSVVIAIAASGAALWIIFQLGRRSRKKQLAWMLIASLVMGAAICGMHYTGMTASVMLPAPNCRFDLNQGYDALAAAVIATSSILLVILTFAISYRLFLFIGLGTLFALPLMAIVYQAVSVMDSNIVFASKEEGGVRYHKSLVELLITLQELNSYNNIVVNGDWTFRNQRDDKKEELRKRILDVEEADVAYGQLINVSNEWQQQKNNLMTLLTSTVTPDTYDINTVIAIRTSLTTFMEQVADSSNLTSDPQPDINFLAESQLKISPEAIETIGALRSTIVGLLASKKSVKAADEKNFNDVQVHLGRLQELNREMERTLQRAARVKLDGGRYQKLYETSIKPRLAQFQTDVNKLSSALELNITTQEFFKNSTELVAQYNLFYEKVGTTFLGFLEERKNDYITKKSLVLHSSLAAFCGLVMLFIFLFRSLSETESAEKEAREANHRIEEEAKVAALLRGVATAANTASDIETVINRILILVCKHMNWPLGHAYECNPTNRLLESTDLWFIENEELYEPFRDYSDSKKFKSGEGLPGRAWKSGDAIWVTNINEDACSRVKLCTMLGIKGAFAYPVKVKGHVTYVLEFFSGRTETRNKELFDIMEDIGSQLSRAIERARHIEDVQNAKSEALEAKAAAEKATSAKSEFLTTMSREIRTPIDSVLAMTSSLLDTELNHEQRAMAEKIRKSGADLLVISNDILDLSKIEQDKLKLQPTSFELINTMKESTDLFAPAAQENGSDDADQHQVNFQGKKVLVVEDMKMNMTLLTKILEKHGCVVTPATNGKEAVTQMDDGKFDIVFMDCQMPEMDGFEATRLIRASETTHLKRRTAIVALTTDAMQADHEKCLKAGMDDYLNKPLKAELITEMLKKWLGKDVA